jgi:hypothetical protein
MLVTVPVPQVPHVPSPCQQVPELAPEPPFKLATGKFPETWVARFIIPEIFEKEGCAHPRFPLAAILVANWFDEHPEGTAARADAVEALPLKAEVIIEAAKLPELSRATTLPAVFAEVAPILADGIFDRVFEPPSITLFVTVIAFVSVRKEFPTLGTLIAAPPDEFWIVSMLRWVPELARTTVENKRPRKINFFT